MMLYASSHAMSGSCVIHCSGVAAESAQAEDTVH